MRSHGPLPLLLFGLLAVGTASAPAQSGTGARRDASPQADAVRRIGGEVARHLARIRVEIVPVVRRVDGTVLRMRPVPEGICGGLVVAPDPLVLISGSACRPDHAGIPLGPARGYHDPPERRYRMLLSGRRELPLEVRRRDRVRNFLVLAPPPGTDVPDGVPKPLPLLDVRRPDEGETLGLVTLLLPGRAGGFAVVPTRIPAGHGHYPRPVIAAGGLAQLGLPVVRSDGALAGILNLPPPEDAAPPPRVDPRAVHSDGGVRDPMEWAGGVRRPVLFSEADLVPFFEELLRGDEGPVVYEGLGLTLARSGGTLTVRAVTPGSPAARAGLAVGDVVLRLEDRETSTLSAFGDALEEALGRGPEVRLEIARDDAPFAVRLSVAP